MALNPKAQNTGKTVAKATVKPAEPTYAYYKRRLEDERKRREEEQKRNAEAQKKNTSVIGEIKGFLTGGKSDIPMQYGHYPLLDEEEKGVRRYSDNIADYDTQGIYDTIAQIEDEEQRDALFSDYYDNYASNTGSRNYNPYVQGVCNDRESREMFGQSSFDQQWINDNAYLANELNMADGKKPSNPTKRSSALYRAAFQWNKIRQAEDTTQRAEAEQTELRRRVHDAYVVDPDASAEDVLGAIDWESEYPTLYAMREGKDNYSPVTLNRGVECSDEYVGALCNAAKLGYKVYDEDNPEGGENWFMTLAEDRAGKLREIEKRRQEAGVQGPPEENPQGEKAEQEEPEDTELEQADDFGEAPTVPMQEPNETGTVAFSDNSPFGALNPETQTDTPEAAASSDSGTPMLDLGNLSTAPQGAGIRTDAAGNPMTMGAAQAADEAIDPNYVNGDLNDIDLSQTQELERAETVRQQAAAELAKPFGERSFDLQMTQAAADVPDAVTGNMDIGVLAQAQQMEADGDEEGARAMLDREARSTVDPKQGYFEDYATTLDEFQNDPEGAKAVLDAVNRAFNSYTPGGKTRMYNRNNTVTTHDMFAAMANEDGTPSDDMLMVYQIEKAKEAAVMQMFGQASVQEIREVEEQFDAAIDDYCMNIVMGAKQAGKEQMYGQMAEWSSRHPVVMGLASIPMNAGAEFMSTVSLIPNVVETAIEGKVDMNTPDAYTHLLVQAQREGSVANLSGGWKFVVNSMYSAVDSVTRVAISEALGGGVAQFSDAIVTALSGAGAATETMRSIYEESGNAGMSIVGGLFGGALEGFTEHMGVDKLTSNWFRTGNISFAFKNGWEALRSLAAQAVSEGFEEVASDVGNTLVNIVATGITGDFYGYTKQYDTLYKQNLASGMDENEAKAQAFSATAWQCISDTAKDFAAGMLSAVPMGGVSTVQGARYTSAAKKSAYSNAMNNYEGLRLYAEDTVNIAADEHAAQETEAQKAQADYDNAAAELEGIRGQIERGEISFEESLPAVAQATDRVNEAQKVLDKAKAALGAARTKLSNAQAEMAKFNRAAMDKAREVTRKYVDENWGGCLTDVRNAMKEGGNADEIMAKYSETPFAEFVADALTPFATKEVGAVDEQTETEREVRALQGEAVVDEVANSIEQTETVEEVVSEETVPVEETVAEETPEPKKLTPYQFRSRALADIADIMPVDDETASVIEGTAAFDEPANRTEANEQLKSVERAYVTSTVVLDQLDTQIEENAQMQQELSASMANMDVNSEQYAQAAEMLNLLKERFAVLQAGAKELDVRNNALLRRVNDLWTKFEQFSLIEQAEKIAGVKTLKGSTEQTEATVEAVSEETQTEQTEAPVVETPSEEDTAEVAENTEPITENMTAVERANALLSKRFDTEVVNPQTIQVDAATFQYKTTDAETGTNAEDTLTGEWRNGLAGEMVVYETADGAQYIADGHHRLQLAKKSGVEEINATILRETDGYTKQDARMYATLRNITQEHGSVHDMARFFRESGLSTDDAQKLGISMNKAKAGEAARIANVSDTTWAAYEAGELSDHAVALAGTMQDKLHEDILVKVLSKKENKRLSNAVMDEIAAAVRMTQEADNNVQMTLGDFIDLGNYTFEEIGRISAAVKKQLAESATAFKRLLGKTGAKAETVEGTTINEDGTKTARAMAEQAQSMFERYAYDPELSKLVSDQAKELRDGNVTITQAVKAVKDAVIERVANANGNQNESSVLGTAAGVRAEGMGNGDTAGEGRNGSVLEQRAERNGVRAVKGDTGTQSAGRDAFVAEADRILGRSGDRGVLSDDAEANTPESDTVKRTAASLKSLSKALGLTYTTRHIGGNVQRQYNGYGVLGYNERHSNVSAFPYLSKVGVWAHESGHGLMNALGLNNDADFMSGLNEAWQNSIPQSFKQGYAGANADTQSREAFAEILRTYIEGGEQAARALAGDSVMNTFLKKLPKNQKKALDKCAAEIQAYNGAELGAQIQSRIVTGRKTDYSGAMDRVIDGAYDRNWAIMKFDVAAHERGTNLKSVSDRAYTRYANLSTAPARAAAILTEEMRSADGTRRIGDSLKDVIAPIKKADMADFKKYLLLKLETDRKVVNEIKNRPLKKAADNAYKEWQAAEADVREKQASLQSSPLEEGEARAAGRLDGYTLEELQERERKARKAADAALDAYDKAMKAVDYSLFPDLTLEQVNGEINQLEAKHSEFAGVQQNLINWLDTFNMEYIVNQNAAPDAAARYAAMKEMYPNYVPAFRVLDDEMDAFATLNSENYDGTMSAADTFGKKLKGNSDRAVLDPIEGIQKIVMQRVINTERVLADRRLAKIADDTPGMGDYLRYLGNTPPSNTQDVLRVVDANGNTRYYQVMDDLLMSELKYSPATAGTVLKALARVKAFMSGMYTTYKPSFNIKNAIKDMFTGYKMSTTRKLDPVRYLGEWFAAQGESLFAEVSNFLGHEISTDTYKQFKAAGGAEMQSLYSATLFNKTNSKIKQALTLLADSIETGTRLAEFRRARRKGETVQGAYRLASDVTTDFSRHGTNRALQLAGKGFLFMNASLQGQYNVIKALEERKLNPEAFAGQVAKTVAVSAVLPVISYMACMAMKDAGEDWEEAYEQLSDDVKRNYYVFPNFFYKKSDTATFGANRFIKLPKPESPLTWLGDFIGRGILDGDDFLDAAVEGLRDMSPFSSPIIAPYYELATNRAWTGKEIESTYWRGSGLPKRYWANDNTSSVAKWLGGLAGDMGINVSPLQIDYFITQTGAPGEIITAFAWGDDSKVKDVFRDAAGSYWDNFWHGIGSRIVTDPTTSTDVINTYYAVANDATDTAAEVKKFKSSVKYPKATKDRMKTVTDRIKAIKSDIGDLYDQIDKVDNDPVWKMATPAARQLEKNRLKNMILAKCIDGQYEIEKAMDKMR